METFQSPAETKPNMFIINLLPQTIRFSFNTSKNALMPLNTKYVNLQIRKTQAN